MATGQLATQVSGLSHIPDNSDQWLQSVTINDKQRPKWNPVLEVEKEGSQNTSLLTTRHLSRNGFHFQGSSSHKDSPGPQQSGHSLGNGSAALSLPRHEDRATQLSPVQTTPRSILRTKGPQHVWHPLYPRTFHISLDVVHQGPDGAGQVPRVLLDADLDQVPPSDRAFFFLFELWGSKGARVCEVRRGLEVAR